jgi:fructokinase
MAHLWGIDLGGTKIEGVILDPNAPERPVCRLRIPTESNRGYAHIRAQISKVCKMMEAETGLPLPKKIGMGTPGVADPETGRMRGSNSQCLNGEMLRRDIEADVQTSFILANDANCFALAEATWGAARGYPTVFGIILGTGVGGGIVANGHILPGRHGIAGEWGQIVLEPNGPVSNYGTSGTIEAMIAGPALELFYAQQAGLSRPLREIAARAGADDPHAARTIEHLTDTFARAICIIIDMLDPHAIIIGGGVGNIDALYTKEMRAKIAARIFSPSFEAALLKPTLGDSAGVFGAAMLVA